MNIAVLVQGGLVEVLQSIPLLRRLEAAPVHTVTLACPPQAAVLAPHLPPAREVLPLDALTPGGGGPLAALGAVAALRRRRLDTALLCSTRARDLRIAYMAGIARRVGLGSAHSAVLLTDRVDADAHDSAAAAWLRLAEPLGLAGPAEPRGFDPGPLARRSAEERLLADGFEDGRLLVAVVLGAGFSDRWPGAAAQRLAWEPERYAHLANQLARRHGAGIILLGTAGDRPVVERVLLDLNAPHLDLCGELTLAEAAAVVERCDLLVAPDCPVLHLAAAVGTPSVGLFGPTDGRLRGAFGPRQRSVQAVAVGTRSRGRGADDAMRRIRVDDVLAGIETAL